MQNRLKLIAIFGTLTVLSLSPMMTACKIDLSEEASDLAQAGEKANAQLNEIEKNKEKEKDKDRADKAPQKVDQGKAPQKDETPEWATDSPAQQAPIPTKPGKGDKPAAIEAVLSNIIISPENGGFNPAFGALLIKGQVMVGSSPCDAAGKSAVIEQLKDANGKITIVAGIRGTSEPNKICPAIFSPVYENVSITVRELNTALALATIKHAEEQGIEAPLTSNCFDGGICTKELLPTTCQFEGHVYTGSNKCDAMAKVKKLACLKQISFETAVCEASPNSQNP